MQPLRKVIDFITYSNIFIGLCAIALTFTNQLTISGELVINRSCWFIFFSTVFTYSYLKIKSAGQPNESTAHRDWAAEHPQLANNILLVSLLATTSFFFLLDRSVMITVFVLALLTGFYGFIQIPFIKPPTKLRDWGLAKTIF